MEEQNEWVKFQDIEWDDPKFNVFSIDTRDFHVGYRWEDEKHPNFRKLKNRSDIFHTEEELKNLLQKLYEESGGAGRWRMFSLLGVKESSGWQMKYIRIWRSEKGFIVCNRDNRPINKKSLNKNIDQEFLSHVPYEQDK